MYSRTLRRVLSTSSFLAVGLFAATAVAQQSNAISGPVGYATTTTVAPKIMGGNMMVPESSKIVPTDKGKKAHTNFVYINPGTSNPLEAPPVAGYAYETPTSLACVYHMVSTLPAGCNPNTVTAVVSGGSQNIAIVDAYDDPEAPADLAYFSAQFGLPFNPNKFQVVYAAGYAPEIDFSGGWETEESLDIEYAHAMAPNAMLYLVEANSNSYYDLFTAVTVATNLVQCGQTTTCSSVTQKGEVSMSWGGGEFGAETTYDAQMNATNVVFFASSGDEPGPIYPATSPNVVSVGGTSIARSLFTGNFITEANWSDAGGGVSQVEPVPAFQSGNAAIKAMVGTHRGTPDVSADANPYTGMFVYDTMPADFFFNSPWLIVGGTSASAPLWAGIVNNAAATTGFAASSNAELTRLYANVSGTNVVNSTNFRDIVGGGRCGYYMNYATAAGYDLCTGIGSPIGKGGK